MKNIFTLFFLLSGIALSAQTLKPGDKKLQSQWLKNETYDTRWLVVNDSLHYEIGRFTTKVVVDKGDAKIIRDVRIKNAKTKWADTTVVALPSLKPVYYASYNLERDIVLHYNSAVNGYYKLHEVKRNIPINDNVKELAFEGSFYPQLIALLPLAEGYKTQIPLHDYNPAQKGKPLAAVTDVKSGTYKTKKGNVNVWVVTVTDNVGGLDYVNTFFIDKKDRKIWRQQVEGKYQKMAFERVE